MVLRLLLTSFATWRPDQPSNAADDLVAALQTNAELGNHVIVQRQLPVDFELAPQRVIAAIEQHQPEIIVCCGMAESRLELTIEANGKHQGDQLQTSVHLDRLIAPLASTTISHDAGNYVCNYLYYQVLQYLQAKQLQSQCVFVHVPVLTDLNFHAIYQDFVQILKSLMTST